LWDAYRTLQVKFSKDGIRTDITAELLARIEYLQGQIDKLNAVKEKLENRLAGEAEISWEYKEVS
jgi:predicted PP-loop superfamily ATPase